MPQCYVETCTNYYEKTRFSRNVIYHMLPSDPNLASKWRKACGKLTKLPYYARVCSEHFSEKCYLRDLQHELLGLPLRKRLKPDAVPDRNLPNSKETNNVRKHPKLSSNKIKDETNTSTPITIRQNTNCKQTKKIEILSQNKVKPLTSSPKIFNFKLQNNNKTDMGKDLKTNAAKLPVRSSFRIAKKKATESLSDSFTAKINKSSQTQVFSDKLKFMAKIGLKYGKRDPLDLPKYDLEQSLKKFVKNEKFSKNEGSYERDVQHELLGLPTRCRLKKGAIPDQNLPNDFLKEDKQYQDSAIAILLAVGLVPAKNSTFYIGGLPEDLNKMQIMEDVREGSDANPPSSPGHAEQGEEKFRKDKINEETTTENGVVDYAQEDEDNGVIEDPVLEEINIKQEQEERKSDEEIDEKQNENSVDLSVKSLENSSINKRKLENDNSNSKKLKSDELEEHFSARDKIMNDFVEANECNNLEQIQNMSDQILEEIKALNELAKEKEREWNQVLHMKKLKEELLIRLQRKRQVLIINESDLGEFQSDTNNGQQSLLKCNQKMNMFRELRAANLEKLKQRNSLLQTTYKQKPMLDVQSIIADYRQRHPETVPRRGRRIRHTIQNDGKISSLNTHDSLSLSEMENSESHPSSNGNSWNRRDDMKSYKDILMHISKLSPTEKTEFQMQLQNASKPPPPYPEVTVHPVTNTSSVAPTNSLLHGILTKGPLKQSSSNGNGNSKVNGGKSSFSPTLARLLTAPEKSGHAHSTPNILGGNILNPGHLSISDIFSGSKVRDEITITPVGSQFDGSSNRESREDESEDQADRLIIDESLENSNTRTKDGDSRSDDGEEVPQCQGCNQKVAQFVCAGCGNQWYCSRDCQVAAWDDHSEVCSG